MKALLIAAAGLLALAAQSNAATIADFGPDPTSAQGAFSNTPAFGPFADQYTFTLTNPSSLTVTSATNVFPNATDFITGFTGALYDVGIDLLPGGGDDSLVAGPFASFGCGGGCQIFSGNGVLGVGAYYLDVSGDAGLTSGYGGNLSTSAVPGPIAGAGLPGLIAACGGLIGLARRRRKMTQY
jgi:hypothetical protein